MTDHNFVGGKSPSVHSFPLPEEKFLNQSDLLYVETDLDNQAIMELAPAMPAPILRPQELTNHTKGFVKAFPGHVMYAMKCNPDPIALQAIYDGGVKRFDAASIAEIRTIAKMFPSAGIYYMHPIKAPEMILEAYMNHGVRAFVLDSYDELEKILRVTNHAPDLQLFVRIAVPKGDVATDFSAKFGAKPEIASGLIAETAKHAVRLGVSFHVGTQCMDPSVYSRAIEYAASVISQSGADVKVLDVGGGFPADLDPQNPPPAMSIYGEEIAKAIQKHKLEGMELLCEAGRGLVAPAGSLIVRIEGRRDDLLYINDGTYGGLFEAGGAIGLPYPCRLICCDNRKGKKPLKAFRLAGPTCDSVDMMNGPFMLPEDAKAGDWIRLEQLGAYGEVSRTDFNGFGTVQKIIVDTKKAQKSLRKTA